MTSPRAHWRLVGILLATAGVVGCGGAPPPVPRDTEPGAVGVPVAPTSTRPTAPSSNDADVTHEGILSAAVEAPLPAEPSEPTAQCPQEMTLIVLSEGSYCIDRWEASLRVVEATGQERPWPGNHRPDPVEHLVRAVSEPGRSPQGYISGEQAIWACERSRKRLCHVDEWVRACRGPDGTTYPYGNERQANVCNDRFKIIDKHPVVRLYRQEAGADADPRGMWGSRWMNDPRLHEYDHTVTKTGAMSGCTNGYGVYDMVGNLHEWVADPNGTFLGGFFLDTFQNGEGCEYRTVAHPVEYHDYSTGFRCCADPT